MRTVRETSRRDRIARASQPYAYPSANGGGNRRVYVNNLSYEVSWQDLKDHMKTVGQVLRADVMQDSNGRSKGCGIVEFATPREANEAIRRLHNSELRGRQIFVREDRENPQSSSPAPGPVYFEDYSDRGGGAPRVVYEREREREREPYSTGSYSTGRGAAGSVRGGGGAAGSVRGAGGVTGVVVENLPVGISWQRLKDHFKAEGLAVTRADLVTPSIGVVDFAFAEDARRAVDQLDRSLLDGSELVVRLRGTERASEREEQEREDEEGSYAVPAQDRERAREGEREIGTKLYVGQLAWSVTWQALKDHFKAAGRVLRADVVREPQSDRSRGFGFVEFAEREDAARAVRDLDGSLLEGRAIHVREDREA